MPLRPAALAAAAIAALAQPALSAPLAIHVLWEPASQTLSVSAGSGCVSGMILVEDDYVAAIDPEARRIDVGGGHGRSTGRDGGPIPMIVTMDCGGARSARDRLAGALAGRWDLHVDGAFCRALDLPIGIGLPDRIEIFGHYGRHRACEEDGR